MNRFVYVIILLVLALASYIIDFSKIFKKKEKDQKVERNSNTESDNNVASNDHYYNEYASSDIKVQPINEAYYNEYDNHTNHTEKKVLLEESGLNIKAVSELKKQGYIYINELLDKTDEELLNIKGIGNKTILQIRAFKL